MSVGTNRSLSDILIDLLISRGKAWVVSQREKYRARGVALDASGREILAGFLREDTLDSVRICRVPEIESPPFHALIEELGAGFNFRDTAGIAFVDTLVVAEPKIAPGAWPSLLFHECVHVVQYRVLGVDAFMDRYVRGWAAHSFDYLSIPLEVDAYALQRRFDASPRRAFSVEDEVRRRLSGPA